ncbi:hypothetical protein J2Z22_004318 [Paenibacillus forsythiae]|uniref:Uncharacterized protein n=1 Tax=Paenibacillus forsythiae TaxID=365616 RepID=A0ABU3HD31_9BACL|nr:hypothetical protein [Paenibacillus forsythiae]MDT3428725.1 hypothetical protein [Paenibacillus forsythiae]
MVTLIVSKAEAIKVIQEQIDKCPLRTQEDKYSSTWNTTTSIILERFFSDQTIAQTFVMKSFSTMKNDAYQLGLAFPSHHPEGP